MQVKLRELQIQLAVRARLDLEENSLLRRRVEAEEHAQEIVKRAREQADQLVACAAGVGAWNQNATRRVSFVLSGDLVSREGLCVDEERLKTCVPNLIANKDPRALEHLTSIEYIATKAFAGGVHSLLQELADAANALALVPEQLQAMESVRRFVGKHLKVLQDPPMPSAVFQLALQEPDDSSVYRGAAVFRDKFGAVEWLNKPRELLGACTMRLDFGDRVLAVAISPDGKLLASASSSSCSISISDSVTGEEKCTLMGHSSWVNCVAWNHDGSLLASGSRDRTVRLWSPDGQGKGTLMGHSDEVKCVAWNHNGSLLASGSRDRTVRLWSPDGQGKGTLKGHDCTGDCICTKENEGDSCDESVEVNEKCPVKGHSEEVTCVAWNHDGSLLASTSWDGTVRLWSPDGQEKGTLKGHSGRVAFVAWNNDGSLLASSSWDKTIKLWDPETMEEKGTLTGHTNSVYCVAWNHDGSLLASGSGDKTVRLWSPDGQGKGTLRGHSDWVYCVAWNHDGSLLASGSCDGTVRLWTPYGQGKGALTEHSDEVTCVAWNHDGTLLASGSCDGNMCLWSPDGQEKGDLTGHLLGVYCVAWNHNGSLLASAGNGAVGNGNIRLCTPDGQEKGTLKGHSGPVAFVAWNNDGSLLASIASWDKTIKLWDPETMEEKGTLTGHSNKVTCIAWNHDGSLLASASSDGTVRLWSPDGQEKGALRRHSMDNPECTCNHRAGFFENVYEANPECPVRGHSQDVYCVTWNHDGSLLASGSWDGTVRLWTPDGQEKGTLRGQSGWVRSVAWNRDGSLLASGSCDGTVRLWTPDGQEKGTLRGHVASWQGLDPKTKELGAKVKAGGSARSNRTGQYIVTAYGDMVYVYKTDLEGGKQREPLACFCSPASVETVSCRGTKLVVWCQDGQVNHCQLFFANGAVFVGPLQC